jgi:hypothetical protein
LQFTSLDLKQQCCPILERCAPLGEIIMRVVRALDPAQLVPEAALGDFAPHAERRQVSSHGPSQIMQSEVRDSVFDAGESGIQGVYSDV